MKEEEKDEKEGKEGKRKEMKSRKKERKIEENEQIIKTNASFRIKWAIGSKHWNEICFMVDNQSKIDRYVTYVPRPQYQERWPRR